MEVLLVVLAGRRYAVPANVVDEVVPRTRFESIDGMPGVVAGLMDHRGAFLPVIDGSQLMHAVASAPFLGSRVAILHVPTVRSGGGPVTARFGLLCDLVTGRAVIEHDAAWLPGDDDDRRSMVGAVGRLERDAIQVIDPRRILRAHPILLPSRGDSIRPILDVPADPTPASRAAPAPSAGPDPPRSPAISAPLPWRKGRDR